MAEEIRIELDEGIELWKVPLETLREQDLNARSMPTEMFARLQETIGRDNRMESLPFCAVTEKGVEIVSGHHRIRAAHAAGLKDVYVLVDVTGLTPSQIKAKQLAHNAIEGTDDASILTQILSQIEDIESKREAFIDPADLDGLKAVSLTEIKVDFDLRAVYLAFLSLDFKRWTELLEKLQPQTEQVAVADATLQDGFKGAMKVIGKSYNIKAITAVICRFMDLATDLKGEADEDWVYLSDIFGPSVPKAVAKVLYDAIEKMKENGDLSDKNKWQLLEYLSADYLAK